MMANKDSEIFHKNPLSVHLKSCDPFLVTDHEPSSNLDETNIPRTNTLFDPIVLTESSDPKCNDGKYSNIIDEFNRLSTRKSTRNVQSIEKTDAKPATRKNRASRKKPALDLLAADIGRGRRSNLVRRARPLAWGLGGKFDEIFMKKTVNNVDANSQDESRALNKGLLLKFKLGTKVIQTCQFNTIPDMDKDLEIYRDNYEKDVFRASNEMAEIGESVENRCLDSGNSPDSEVINVIPVPSKDCISHKSGDVVICEKQGAFTSFTTGIASSNTFMRELLHETEIGVSMDMLTVESVAKSDLSIAGIESVESKSNGQDLLKSSKLKSIFFVKKNKTNCWQKGLTDTETHPVITETHETNDDRGLEESSRSNVEPLSISTVPESAWVCCDDCHKWRRISTILADYIGSTECRWICKDNMDKTFADCSISQEKSNADINAELELSEASCEEDACNTRLNSGQLVQKQHTDPPQPSWKLIKTNMFLHRNRRNQPIDEIMVCHCKPPIDGRMGCRDECLNRMLNIECVKGTCPCGEFCSNQQFQKRKYSKLKYFSSGKKGYGLQLQEDIHKGRFLIEYVGEVLGMPAYEARQKEYASKGHKHFYFMTLNASEVIDACAKGNLGRFINHSCEPNCRTEKWMVNGEVCIGLFAIRDIKKGEELTFDYNYVRVFGAAAKKCVCGSSRCRGVIGGDPLNDETIVLGDSDDDYPEPVTFYENNNKLNNVISFTITAENTFKNEDHSPDSLLVTDEINDEPTTLIEPATSASESKSEHTEGLSLSLKVKNLKSEIKQQKENINSLLLEEGDSKKKPKPRTNEKKGTVLKPQYRSKLHFPPSLVKKGKFKSKQPEIDGKPLVVPQKDKKLVVDNLTGRFEAVEEALNTLLSKGGISKRRDAWKGYLTLLCLTANGGNGEGIQSNRDLSMILDALLRTKSRTVLLDIINKNGLQMLHILIKRYRKVFSKTPILRKLLKVLEFLAETKILTLDIILKPSLPGVESFKESILSLTEHADKEVHQIARNFRYRFIPWSARRVNRTERDSETLLFQQNSNFKNFPSQHSRERNLLKVSGTILPDDSRTLEDSSTCPSSFTDKTQTRKRKSRWDQPGDIKPDTESPPVTATWRRKTVTGQPQDCYNSRLPTAFGVPCSLFKKTGTPEDGGTAERWIVAPAMTFHSFPPLPLYPRNDKLHLEEKQKGRNGNFGRDRNANMLGKRYFKQQKWNGSRSSGQLWNPNKYGSNEDRRNSYGNGYYQ